VSTRGRVYRVEPMTAHAAAEIVRWRHPPPYDTYDFDGGELVNLREELRYHSVLEGDDLVGYCCFGDDARVPGGVYADDALDVGWGMRPDLMGQGRSRLFLAAILEHARRSYRPAIMRVTIAVFNQRSRRAALRAGFTLERERFSSPSGTEFAVLVTPEDRGHWTRYQVPGRRVDDLSGAAGHG
jgi:[ribosomal protein S18]-alanine N-acetyltransferase